MAPARNTFTESQELKALEAAPAYAGGLACRQNIAQFARTSVVVPSRRFGQVRRGTVARRRRIRWGEDVPDRLPAVGLRRGEEPRPRFGPQNHEFAGQVGLLHSSSSTPAPTLFRPHAKPSEKFAIPRLMGSPLDGGAMSRRSPLPLARRLGQHREPFAPPGAVNKPGSSLRCPPTDPTLPTTPPRRPSDRCRRRRRTRGPRSRRLDPA